MPRHTDQLASRSALRASAPRVAGTRPDDAAFDSPPVSWSQLGRRVLAEAWTRFTEEHADTLANPVVPALPREDER